MAEHQGRGGMCDVRFAATMNFACSLTTLTFSLLVMISYICIRPPLQKKKQNMSFLDFSVSFEQMLITSGCLLDLIFRVWHELCGFHVRFEYLLDSWYES